MFDIDAGELLVCAIVALVVIGPKDLPRAMRVVGQWVGRARGVARHFRSGIDTMIREAELEEMEKRWAAENERIMREHPDEVIHPVDRRLSAPLPPETIDVAPGVPEAGLPVPHADATAEVPPADTPAIAGDPRPLP
jgi:sec-independent protein translocase protein TatB